MANINKLVEELGQLTMQEAADMGKMMEEKCVSVEFCQWSKEWASLSMHME